MRTHALLSFAAVSLAMLGCDGPPKEQKSAPPAQLADPVVVAQSGAGAPAKIKPAVGKKCKKDDCDIKVFVTEACKVSVEHDKVGVTKGIPDVPIRWTIQDNGYEFTASGIVFKTTPPSFPSGSPSANNQTFTVVDKNSEPGDDLEYGYSVTVKPRNSNTPCPTLDPTIINGY
jgi:hypothetical protein